MTAIGALIDFAPSCYSASRKDSLATAMMAKDAHALAMAACDRG